MKSIIAIASLALGASALAVPAVEGNVRGVNLDEEPPQFDYWDLTEAQRASYAVMIASPTDPTSGQQHVTVKFDIRRDDPVALEGGKPKPDSDEDFTKNGVEDDDGDIVGVLECNYSAGIPRVSYGYIRKVVADASGDCEYHAVGGDQPSWVRWDMVLLLQMQPGNGWMGQATYSQTSFEPSWDANNTTVESILCLNKTYTNTVPVFVDVPHGFNVTFQPVGISIAWASIIDCPSNPYL